jgi:hypothetical protein
LSLALHDPPAGLEDNDAVPKPISLACKQKMLAHLTGKDAISPRQLAMERPAPTNALALVAGGE